MTGECLWFAIAVRCLKNQQSSRGRCRSFVRFPIQGQGWFSPPKAGLGRGTGHLANFNSTFSEKHRKMKSDVSIVVPCRTAVGKAVDRFSNSLVIGGAS